MRIGATEYAGMRGWLAAMCGELLPGAASEADPIAALDRIAAESPARAREGLAMAVGDFVEMISEWPAEDVAALDSRLKAEGLPSLSAVRIRFSQAVARAMRRGQIRDETEYYAVRNAAEMFPQEQDRLWALLVAYEAQATG
jgi:hypothetical protein